MIPIPVLAVITGVTVLLLSVAIGLMAGSRWLGVWVMGKLIQRKITRERRRR
jgi:hypothetical protein